MDAKQFAAIKLILGSISFWQEKIMTCESVKHNRKEMLRSRVSVTPTPASKDLVTSTLTPASGKKVSDQLQSC